MKNNASNSITDVKVSFFLLWNKVSGPDVMSFLNGCKSGDSGNKCDGDNGHEYHRHGKEK